MPSKQRSGTPADVAHDYDVFISYSRTADLEAAIVLQRQLEQEKLSVFRDETGVRWGDLWLDRLQAAVDTCGAFVLLIGRDGVRRWIGAETQAALARYFGPHDDAARLPLFPILLGETAPETLPAFLRLFQATPWDGESRLDPDLIAQIRAGNTVASEAIRVEGCPFVGLEAFGPNQAHLFFGRQKEILDALACFDARSGAPRVRWLEINGGSGSGKSSLMNAGLLPLVDQGWLWPRTGYERWRRIGPLMPGERPLAMLAEHLARAFGAEMSEVRRQLEDGDDPCLAEWLRSRKPDDTTAFLLSVDQFEELFTFADPVQRRAFDRLLAAALADADCPLFLMSTVRADFLDRFEQLPRLLDVRNRLARPWTLPMMSADGLREIIDGPARLAGLDVSEVREAIVADAEGEEGALPLVQNALTWLWEQRKNGKLSGKVFNEAGRMAGILSRNAESALQTVDRGRALDLLLRLVRIDPEGRRHARQRISLGEAVEAAGGGQAGTGLLYRLSGRPEHRRRVQLPLIVVTPGAAGDDETATVNLIHETLIRSRGLDEEGNPRPYWPTLWAHLEANRNRAVMQGRVRLLALEIEDAAQAWHAAGRDEAQRWPESRCQEVIREVRRAGLPLRDALLSETAHGFFGPAERDTIERSIGAGASEDPSAGSGYFGDRWRLPLSDEARADLGDRLALIGDDRPGVGVRNGRPDIDWCEIEGGEITIELAPRRRPIGLIGRLISAIGTKPSAPRQARAVVEPFRMARYPVTIWQFRAFVEACHRDGRWHLDGFPVDKLEEPPRHAGRYGNYPADTVSWYDATAFCRWLSGQLGFEVRLPTEFEWQLAATGGDSENIYPWDPDRKPEREPWRANTCESGLGRTTAVGLYPAGASRARIHDLAGTVFEWCSSVHEDGSTGDVSDNRPRVLRGGSWNAVLCLARCASRASDHPLNRNGNIGFRVVCSSPISSADP